MSRITQLEIHKEELGFSAGHFTIFSATEREHLHGHNYYVSICFDFLLSHNGLSFDYRYYKKKMLAFCDELDRRFLLPSDSPYLTLEDHDNYWHAHFNQQILPFLKEDVVILPLTNITIEELAHWFLQKIVQDQNDMKRHAIHAIVVKVYNGEGQSSSATWQEKA